MAPERVASKVRMIALLNRGNRPIGLEQYLHAARLDFRLILQGDYENGRGSFRRCESSARRNSFVGPPIPTKSFPRFSGPGDPFITMTHPLATAPRVSTRSIDSPVANAKSSKASPAAKRTGSLQSTTRSAHAPSSFTPRWMRTLRVRSVAELVRPVLLAEEK